MVVTIVGTARIHLTKLAAAQRQLRAAVRMFFAGEDDLAIHTVASAAYRVLSDLKAERGKDEVGDYYLTTIFYAVREYRRGTLPGYLANDPEAMKWIREIAEQLPIYASTKFEDIAASVSSEVTGEFWRKRNKVANFLKHADRDPKSHIALDEVDNLNLLMQTFGSYVDLINDDLGAEGLVFLLYFSVTSGVKEGLPPELHDIATELGGLSPNEQLNKCCLLLEGMGATE
jgi:hypothetical protein